MSVQTSHQGGGPSTSSTSNHRNHLATPGASSFVHDLSPCNCSTPSGSFLYPGRVTEARRVLNLETSLGGGRQSRQSDDSIPFADADSNEVAWSQYSSSSSGSSGAVVAAATSSEGALQSEERAVAEGVVTECCSLNNLLDALAMSEGGGVSGAFSFSTLRSESEEEEDDLMMSQATSVHLQNDASADLPSFLQPQQQERRSLPHGHTLPRRGVRWNTPETSAPPARQQEPMLSSDSVYYCKPQPLPSHEQNGGTPRGKHVSVTNPRTRTLPATSRMVTDNAARPLDKDVLISPVTPGCKPGLGMGGAGGGMIGGGLLPRPPSPPSPGSMDDVPPPPPQPHYISTLRANSRRGNSPEKERDPLAGLQRFLRAFYRELAARDPPHPPPWAPALPPGALSPAFFQPALRLVAPTPPGEACPLRLDQLLTAIRLEEGALLEAPRRVLVEGAPGSGKTSLALRLLHSWATRADPWLSSAVTIALLVPLRELRASGSGLANFIGKILLPRAALGGARDGFSRAWRRLAALEEKLLIVLDGDYEEDTTSGDALDLLEGRLFPDARVLVTMCPGRRATTLGPFVQRRVVLAGLQLSHVARLTTQYFAGKRVPDGAARFLDALGDDESPLRSLAEWPLGWILLCVMFEERSGGLPDPEAPLHEIYQALFRTMVLRSLSRRGVALSDSVDIPGHCKKLLAEFGKLTLSCLSSGRYVYMENEVRAACRGLEVTELGFLTRGLQFGRGGRRSGGEVYHVIYPAFSEFLAAFYVSSVVHYANILRRELVEVPGLLQPEPQALVPRLLMGLLGRKGFLVLEQLCPLDVSVKVLFSLLQACGPGEANVAAACRLLRGTGAGGTGAAQVVHSTPSELRGWGLVLGSQACPLQALELVVQSETVEPGALDAFFSSLALNESVRAVRISSLLGHELSAEQVSRLARYVALTLPKGRLQTFELVITCVEDSPPDRFQPLVDSLCATFSRGDSVCPRVSKLVLDLSLGSAQLAQLCTALEGAPAITVLHLPHLGCGPEGLRALASLMRVRPLLALNLSGSWGALVRENDPPSSSSGGSTTDRSSHLYSRQINTLGSPKTGSYFSLPRSHAFHSLSRGATATLPRPPGTPTDDKRLSDSALFQKLCSMPATCCDSAEHRGGSGFHAVFEAAREPHVCLRALNVSKCALGPEDAMCLGETVRRSRSLAALRLEGASRLAEVLPVLMALPDAPALQLLDLGSPRLALTDPPTQLLLQALTKSPSLRLLGLDGWTFRVEDEGTLSTLVTCLQSTGLRDLVLSHCRLQLTCHDGRLARLGRRDDSEVRAELLAALPEFSCPSVAFLRLAGLHVSVNHHVALRGPHLLPFLKGFSRLSELDLGLDRLPQPSTTPGTDPSSSIDLIDDKTLVSFFSTLSHNFRSLQTLRLGNWRVRLEDAERSLRSVGRSLRSCSLSHLRVDGLSVSDGAKTPLEHLFLQTAVSNLGLLTWLAMEGVVLQASQAVALGRAIRERFAGPTLRISASDVSSEAIKALITSTQEGARAEVTFLGGSGCNLRVQRVVKNHKLRGRLRRFTSLKD